MEIEDYEYDITAENTERTSGRFWILMVVLAVLLVLAALADRYTRPPAVTFRPAVSTPIAVVPNLRISREIRLEPGCYQITPAGFVRIACPDGQ